MQIKSTAHAKITAHTKHNAQTQKIPHTQKNTALKILHQNVKRTKGTVQKNEKKYSRIAHKNTTKKRSKFTQPKYKFKKIGIKKFIIDFSFLESKSMQQP